MIIKRRGDTVLFYGQLTGPKEREITKGLRPHELAPAQCQE
jgi:hypothetical protein